MALKETKENEKRYLGMTAEELSKLSDEELFEAAMTRTENKVDSFDEWSDGVNSLNYPQKVFYSLNWLETEVNNGGLCQFFVNSSRTVAPFISEYMSVVGADEHKKLFDDFISENGIDINDISSFIIEDTDEFEEQNERYPFDDYDDKFYELEPLEAFLTIYVKENISEF